MLCSEGPSLRYSPGWGNLIPPLWLCKLRWGSKGINAAGLAVGWLSVPSPAFHKPLGPFWCRFLRVWACAHCRTLWISAAHSPLWLGVSPALKSFPKGFITRGFEGLFPCSGTLGCTHYLSPQMFLPVYPHRNMALPGSPAAILLTWSSSRSLAMCLLHLSCPSLLLLAV